MPSTVPTLTPMILTPTPGNTWMARWKTAL
jgi:hypothetical protein